MKKNLKICYDIILIITVAINLVLAFIFYLNEGTSILFIGFIGFVIFSVIVGIFWEEIHKYNEENEILEDPEELQKKLNIEVFLDFLIVFVAPYGYFFIFSFFIPKPSISALRELFEVNYHLIFIAFLFWLLVYPGISYIIYKSIKIKEK